MLEKRGFNVDKFKDYTNVEIETMRVNNSLKGSADVQPLDILTNNSAGEKVFVKYIFEYKN